MSWEQISQRFYLRKFPDALQRKKVKKILKEGKKAKQNSAAAQASASGRARAGAHASNTAGAHSSNTDGAHSSNTDGAHSSNTASAHSSNTDGAQTSGNVDDRANSICWFCHGDVTSLENNKCAGCRKVTQLRLCSLQILRYKTIFQARYCDERCQKADWGRHGDYCVLVQEKIRKKKEAKKAGQEMG